MDQGLPQAFVSDIVSDDDGFIWVGTRDGLARYDGHQFVAFQHRPDDPTSPIDNVVAKLWKGRRNEIWVQYETGDIDRLNPQTGHCWHLTRQPAFAAILKLPFSLGGVLQVDQQGNLWGALKNEGVFCCDFNRQRLLRFRRATHNLSSDTVMAITLDRRERLWFITQQGVSRLNVSTNRFETVLLPSPYETPKGYDGLPVGKISTLLRTNGEVLFGDRTHLFFFNPDRRTIRSIQSPVAGRSDLQFMAHSPSGQDYVEANGTVYQLTDQGQAIPTWRYETGNGTLLTGVWCTGMHFDRVGVLWMGGNTLGLLRINLAAAPLHSYAYQTIFCQDVFQQEMNLSLVKELHWPFDKELPRMYSSYMVRSDFDRQGHLWIGLGDEVGYYDFPTRRFTLLPPIPDRVKISLEGGQRGLSIAPDGRLWIVTQAGQPFWYDSQTSQWRSLQGRRMSALPPTLTHDLLADSTALWISTISNGLVRVGISDRRVQSFNFGSAADNQPRQSLIDLEPDPTRPNILWIGSYQGLIRFDKKTGRYQRFTTAQGLPNNTIYSVLADRQGYLWLATNKGLCRFHPIRHSILNLKTSDGLLGDEFNRFHHLRLPDGRLAFGGLNGWVLFDPALIKADQSQPTIALTDLRINNKLVDQYSIRSPLAAPVNKLSTLVLPYDQNYLTFEFAALNTHQPDRVTYRYQLLGYDNNWTMGSPSTATYTKLPPGHYTLQVNAANGAGEWSSHTKRLAIVIEPPLWASKWAYGFYTLLAMSALVGFIRFRTRQDRKRHELILRERQANELQHLDQAKTRFFANVSHELRTPLSLMLGPLDSVLKNQQLTNRDEQLVRTAERNTRHLLSLVNQLLDFTKLDAGKMDVNPHPVQLKSLINSTIASFDSQAQQEGIKLTSDMPIDGNPVIELDERKFRQVLINLLANALKFTPTGGSVLVTVHYEQSQVRVAVSDTGRGILPDDLPHVFDRFFQTKQLDASIEGGSGIGLALCQEIVRLMQGHIWADSKWGKGSTFTLIIPAPEHILSNEAAAASVSEAAPTAITDVIGSFPKIRQSVPEEHKDSVLVVEDNLDLREYMTTILSPFLIVQTAGNGQLALDLLDSMPQPPSLIISDIMMPVMDGFQLLKTLKAHESYRRIPVIMLTARAELADKLQALRIGVDDYLLKPFDEDELTARISALLRNQRERSAMLAASVSPVENEPTGEPVPPVSDEDARLLQRLEELTISSLDNYNLTADELADSLAMSRRTFYRTIKRLTGLTPTQYLTEARFRQARYLLETRQVSTIKQVAHRVGFRQVSHFAQTYQQRFGKHPTEYF
ncbi:hypothetical protein GCM10028817_07000 [Spirosoma pomorum]